MEKIRASYLEQISKDVYIVPVVALLGPRQCGKTTIARRFAKDSSETIHYFDLENYTDLTKFANPKMVL
jgi:predicted AAA+ superfamily ATPase